MRAQAQLAEEHEVSSAHVATGRRGRWRWGLLVVGTALGAAAIGLYAADGFSRGMAVLWTAALCILLFSFESGTARMPRLALRDVVIAIGIGGLFLPLYLVGSYAWPYQVNSDETVIMDTSDRWASARGVDPFGISDLFRFPALLFIVWGKLGHALGGIDLGTMRLLHGAVGLATLVVSYALFRQLLPRRWAIFAVAVLGVNHSLFMISRMALRENTAVLVEVAALALLLQGLRREAPGPTFVGGLVAGLGFYVYYPGRSVFLVWLAFLVLLALFFRKSWPLGKLVRAGLVAAAGVVLVAAPILIAEAKAPALTVDYQRTALLIYPEGRKLQKEWVNASTEWDGFKTNVRYGLTAFNNFTVDHSWLYPNWGHGFVDPLTGALLWIGVAVVLVRLIRRSEDPWPLLPLTGFVFVWLALSLVVNKAPNYTRLLVALPFVAFLVTEAVRFLVALVRRYSERWGRRWAVAASAALAVAVLAGLTVWNLAIAYDFVERGNREGNALGGTGRYIDAHGDSPDKAFYLSAGGRYPYYNWGWPSLWMAWMEAFADEGQVKAVVPPNRVAALRPDGPFALFLSRRLWTDHGDPLRRRYPAGRLRDITPDGSLVVFDVAPTGVSR